MSLAEDYRPCKNCGTLTDSGVCSDRCADDLAEAARFKRRLAAGEIDEDGNELGDFCLWCSMWFDYRISAGPYCDNPTCRISAERD